MAAIPLTAFYRPGSAESAAAGSLLRLAFCKDRPTIELALERLAGWSGR